MSIHSNPSAIAELQEIGQTLHTIEPDNPAVTDKSALIARYNQLVDALWIQHIANRLDPARYLPIEIVNLIFSFVVYHVVELESSDHFNPQRNATLPNELIAGFRDGPLILASVSKYWYQIAVNYPSLWSTIIIDQSEDDCLERVHLFLDRSGKELLDIILRRDLTSSIHLRALLIEHADRFKTLVGHPTGDTIPTLYPSQLDPLESSAGLVNWSEYSSRRHGLPIPKCLHHVQLDLYEFDSESLIQFTSFRNLESLFITIRPEPKDTQWDMKLRFERLRHLHLRILDLHWNQAYTSVSSGIEWLECPVLVDLELFYDLFQKPSEEMHPQLQATVLRFRYLQRLQVHINFRAPGQKHRASRFQNMGPSMFYGSLEFVQLTFGPSHIAESAWAADFTERFFTIFVPKTHLRWEYMQFPSPAITANLRTLHINGSIIGLDNALVAPEMAKLKFPSLEELYLRRRQPIWMNRLHAPRLIYLDIDGFAPSDLRHISHSILSSVYLQFWENQYASWEIFLPSADRLEVGLRLDDLFRLNLHSSQIRALTITANWVPVTCPPYWTTDYISRILGNVTELNLIKVGDRHVFQDLSKNILSFIKPLVFLKHLTLFRSSTNEYPCIDRLAQHLLDPGFLPKLETLSISEYPSWPYFFQYIQQRQAGFLAGHFQTALKRITIKGPVHGAFLEHLRESLAGKYIGMTNMPPRRKGSKEWPAQPFGYQELDIDGFVCCYACHKAGLEVGCMMSFPASSSSMEMCARHSGPFPLLSTVFAP